MSREGVPDRLPCVYCQPSEVAPGCFVHQPNCPTQERLARAAREERIASALERIADALERAEAEAPS